MQHKVKIKIASYHWKMHAHFTQYAFSFWSLTIYHILYSEMISLLIITVINNHKLRAVASFSSCFNNQSKVSTQFFISSNFFIPVKRSLLCLYSAIRRFRTINGLWLCFGGWQPHHLKELNSIHLNNEQRFKSFLNFFKFYTSLFFLLLLFAMKNEVFWISKKYIVRKGMGHSKS